MRLRWIFNAEPNIIPGQLEAEVRTSAINFICRVHLGPVHIGEPWDPARKLKGSQRPWTIGQLSSPGGGPARGADVKMKKPAMLTHMIEEDPGRLGSEIQMSALDSRIVPVMRVINGHDLEANLLGGGCQIGGATTCFNEQKRLACHWCRH